MESLNIFTYFQIFSQIIMSCIVYPVFDLKLKIDLMNINELSVNFDVQVKYFLHIHFTNFHDLIYVLCNCQGQI